MGDQGEMSGRLMRDECLRDVKEMSERCVGDEWEIRER